MNRTRRPSAALLFALCLPFPAFAASDAADSAYWDYRNPAHHWHQWTASLSGNASHYDYTRSNDLLGQGGEFQGQARSAATGGFSSDPLAQWWGLDLSYFGRRSHSEISQSLPTDYVRDENTRREVSERVIGSYAVRAFPWAFPWGFTASTQQRLEWTQALASYEVERAWPGYRRLLLASEETGRWVWNANVDLGTGIGRVRDVTPVYEAQVLEARLIGSGALSRPLSRPARERLAALLTMQSDVSYPHDRPDKYFWEEVERVLVEDGALERGSLTLFEAHRILEPTSIRGRIFRSAGWFVGPAVSLSESQYSRSIDGWSQNQVYYDDTLYSAPEAGYEFDEFRRDDFISTTFIVEYHRPVGPNWQFDFRQRAAIQESGARLFSYGYASAMWVVSDRWLSTAFVQHNATWNGPEFEDPAAPWTIMYGADLSYFLEDRWALTLSGVETQDHTPYGHSRQGSYSLGITYVFSGLFEAPGITAAMHPIPGGR